jgi:hypothetical protein
MTFRHVTRRVTTFSAAMALTGTVVALAFATPAFAAPPAAGSEVPSSVIPIGASTPGPFASGQVVEVKIPANPTLVAGAGINIVECAAPGGVAPTDPSQCDGLTLQPDTILAAADGSVAYTVTGSTSGYTMFALPDTTSLGESATGTPVCNTSNECVLYIGENQNDFTQPHFFSQPYFVTPTAGDSGTPAGDGTTPGTATPEAPLAIGLPLAAAGVVAGSLFLRRRRHAVASDKR